MGECSASGVQWAGVCKKSVACARCARARRVAHPGPLWARSTRAAAATQRRRACSMSTSNATQAASRARRPRGIISSEEIRESIVNDGAMATWPRRGFCKIRFKICLRAQRAKIFQNLPARERRPGARSTQYAHVALTTQDHGHTRTRSSSHHIPAPPSPPLSLTPSPAPLALSLSRPCACCT